MISIIAAIGKNREIGLNNQLLWYLPGDLKHFRETTLNHTIIMGKKTFDSIGRPLPKRRNIVITNNQDLKIEGVEIENDINNILEKYQNSDEEVFVIGGASIYQAFLPYAQKLYLTQIDAVHEADTYFPDFSDFKIIKEGELQQEKDTSYQFTELEKNN